MNGTWYSEGKEVPYLPAQEDVNATDSTSDLKLHSLPNDPCKRCFCFNGRVECQSQDCDAAPAMEDCAAVLQEGNCCPLRYDCGKDNMRVRCD